MTRPVFLFDPDNCRQAQAFARQSYPPRRLRSQTEVRTAFAGRSASLWIALHADVLLRWLSHAGLRPRRHRLLVLDRLAACRSEILRGLFASVVVRDGGWRLLPAEELAQAVSAENAADLIIGGVVDHEAGVVRFIKGDLDSLLVPIVTFRVTPHGPKPDLDAMQLTDCGQTVKLGEYEAAADAILYEHEPSYRKRVKARRRRQDGSFGGCLRRLRLQQGVRRDDFPGISAKEIARIERSEIRKPHAATIKIVARKLGVEPAAITEY
jgi:hypothetical protein